MRFIPNIFKSHKFSLEKGKRLLINPLFPIIVIAVFLRIYHLDYFSLWNDEIYFFDLSKRATLFNTTEFFHLPFAPLLIRYSTNLLGTSDFAIRLPFVIFNILSVVMIYLVGKSMFNKSVGLIAAFLLTISTNAIGIAQEAKLYSLVTFFPMAALFFLYKIFDREFVLKNLVLFLFSVVLTLYAGFVGLQPVTAFLLYGLFLLSLKFLIVKKKGFRLKYPKLTIFLFVFISSALVIVYFGFIRRMLVANTFNLGITPLNSMFSKERINIVRGVIQEFSNGKLYFYFFVWALFYPFFFRKGIKPWIFLFIYALMLFVYFFMFTIKFNLVDEPGTFPINLPRYYTPFLPVYLLTISLGIFNISSLMSGLLKKIKIFKSLEIGGLIILLIVGVFSAFSLKPLYNYYFVPQGFSVDWRSAGEYLETHTSAGDVFVRGIREQRDTNYISPYFDYQKKGVEYSIFPVKEKNNNWYISPDFDFPDFEDWTISSSIHPSFRSYPLRVFKLTYIGQGNEIVKVEDKTKWKISTSPKGNSLNLLSDGDTKVGWESNSPLSSGDFVQVDMGENKILTRIGLISQLEYNIKDYLIQTSLDGDLWETVQAAFTSNDPYFYYYPQLPFAPSKARFLKIISLSNDRLPWVISEIDLYEVEKRKVPNLYDKQTKFNGLVVSDSDASNGYAKFVPKYSPSRFRLFQYGERFVLPPGFYRAKFRIKTDDNKKEDNLENITDLMIDLGLEKVGEYLPKPLKIRPTDFKETNNYQNFYLNFSHDGIGHVVFRIRDYGLNNYWFDFPEIEKIR